MKEYDLEEILGFTSPGELLRFREFLDDMIKNKFIEKMECKSMVSSGLIFGGIFFRTKDDETWCFSEPDGPSAGAWQKVI